METTYNRSERTLLRIKRAFETDYVRFLLRSLGCEDLMNDLLIVDEFPEPYALFESLWHHPRIEGLLPMTIEAWSRQCQTNEPSFHGLLQQLLIEQPGSVLAAFLKPDWERTSCGDLAVGVIVPFRSETVIIHTLPEFSQGKPKQSVTLPNGCVIAMHRARPFLMDIANEYRMCLAGEGSELYDRIESGWDFDCDGDGTWEQRELR